MAIVQNVKMKKAPAKVAVLNEGTVKASHQTDMERLYKVMYLKGRKHNSEK